MKTPQLPAPWSKHGAALDAARKVSPAQYQELLERAYNPRLNLLRESFRMVGAISTAMLADGYTIAEVYTICDAARFAVGLETIARPMAEPRGARDYNPDCPACLRNVWHTAEEHEQALARNAQASSADYGEG